MAFAGFGETPSIAEEMAARDVLRNMFGTTQHHAPLTLKPAVELNEKHFTENYSVPEYFLSETQQTIASESELNSRLLEADIAL